MASSQQPQTPDQFPLDFFLVITNVFYKLTVTAARDKLML